MGSTGIVRTARGRSLNLGELIMKSKSPLKSTADMKDKVQVKKVRKAVNVRGFSPGQGDAPKEIQVIAPKPEIIPIPHEPVDPGPTNLAEVTQVRVDKPKYHKHHGKSADLAATTNAALAEVLQEITENPEVQE